MPQQAVIEPGGDKDIPALTDFLKLPENQHIRVSIQGHVNFGQRPEDALKLSNVCSKYQRFPPSIPTHRPSSSSFGALRFLCLCFKLPGYLGVWLRRIVLGKFGLE